MGFWVPPAVSRELQASTRQHNAEVLQQSRVDSVCVQFNRELRRIDPYLEMRFFGPLTLIVGAVPNRYHLTRQPPVGPWTLISITGPGGEFVEPSSAIFTQLAKGDMWNAEANRDRERSQRLAEQAAERQKNRERDDRREELKDRFKAAFETSVSMNRDTPWSQNASATARRGRGTK